MSAITATIQGKKSRGSQFQVAEDTNDKSQAFASGVIVIGLAIAGLAWLAMNVTTGKYYTPRSGLGFYLGVGGALMMLALLAYPLRKRMRWMQRWGALKHWFRIHMWIGILGPLLVLFHSTFHVRSINGAVALFSMLFVVASGIIGRFVYTQIHYGLYGRRASLGKLQEELHSHAEDAKSRFHVALQVEMSVRSFEQHAIEEDRPFPLNVVHFFSLGLHRRWVALRCTRQLRRLRRWSSDPVEQKKLSLAMDLVSPYLHEVQRVAQFSAYERLFSLWHVLHVPLIYLLAASTIVHVIAAYMY